MKRIHVRTIVIAALVAALTAGCGGSKSSGSSTVSRTAITDPAAAFAVRVDAQLANRRFGKAWLLLHPAQQRFLSSEALTSCWSRSRESQLVQRLRFEAKNVRDELWPVAGVSATPRPSKAVRVRIVDPRSKRVLYAFTQHVFAVGGHLRWIVSPQILRDFRRGACGST